MVSSLEVTAQLALDDGVHVDGRDGGTLTFRAVGTAGPVCVCVCVRLGL